ncbi:MalM family protein [Psychromonas sp. MME2]|uniref:MalM family protein n=1 Tax=Psychromonas sp. MME2 TaxID=3231033 RepID=UPI00339D1CE1
MKIILAIGLIIFATGCSSNNSMLIDYGDKDTHKLQKINPALGYQALEQASVCCTTLSELNYLPISQPDAFDFVITEKSDVFNFTTGKSFVQGVTLPLADGSIKVAVSAPIVSSVFVPTILLLDDQYEPLRLYGEETITYQSGSLLNIDRFFANIEVPAVFDNDRHAKYLIILTTQKAMQGTTTLTLPEPSSAEIGREALIIKEYNNKPLPHTATGVVRLAFDYKPNGENSAKNIMVKESNTDSQKAQAIVATKEMSNIKPKATIQPTKQSATSEAATATTPPINKSIQPESEEMYLLLIEKSVKNEDYKKALHFVEEAERAGSTKARDAMFDAMKKYQK